MKILFSWNLWNNFDDLEIASEIVYNVSKNFEGFDIIQISQSGYEEYENKINYNYILKHFKLNIDENHPIISLHKKNMTVMRIFNSFINAYNYSVENNCDFFLVNHADAWILELNPLFNLLKSQQAQNSAILCRMGINASVDNSFNEFVPFYDDHYLIFNTRECSRLGVFTSNFDFLFNSFFLYFGGIHYLLKLFFDKEIPTDKLFVYSNLLNCKNHYNDFSGYNLIPLQFDDKFSFLHANCEQLQKLHPLRLKYLMNYRLDDFPSTRKYKKKYLNLLSSQKITTVGNYSYFNESVIQKIYIKISQFPFDIKRRFELKYFKRYMLFKMKIRNYNCGALYYVKLTKHIVPLGITQRK
jgi:hypothetical protein